MSEVAALAGVAGKATARLCLSESCGLGSRNEHKLTRPKMPSPVKTETVPGRSKKGTFCAWKTGENTGSFQLCISGTATIRPS